VDLRALLASLATLEGAGVLFSVAYLVLAIRESLWCWPAAFVSSVLTVVVLAHARLYSEAALNVFYAAMAVYGWVQWRFGGRSAGGGTDELPIGVWPLRAHAVALAAVAAASLALGWAMHRYTGAAFPYLDAFVTVSSIVTTYMVAKKLLENWIYWLVIDSLSLGLYVARELYLYAGLFALYLVLVVLALRRWHRQWRAQGAAAVA
jgi:nicotinamide mononucleotide transporter